MKLTNVSKVYIIHYKKLLDRKKYICDFFNFNNITNYEFRENYQRENLTDETKTHYFKLNNLNSSQICITIEHIETYREIINSCQDENEWYLILEDDSIFCDNFIDKLNFCLENIPNDAEYLDICDYFIINHNDIWVRNNSTRTTCAYLINKKTCEKLLNTIIPFEKAIDHELNKQFNIHDIKVYWSSKSLIHHGSGTNYSGSYEQWRC
jgi:hypothetical protein